MVASDRGRLELRIQVLLKPTSRKFQSCFGSRNTSEEFHCSFWSEQQNTKGKYE
jgi:hypothetical protein